MTTPDLSFIIPSKAKAWVGLVGAGLSFVVPFILEATEGLPAPWPAIIGAVLWLLTALGVYKAPYRPTGTVLVPEEAVTPPVRSTGDVTVVREGEYRNPWK